MTPTQVSDEEIAYIRSQNREADGDLMAWPDVVLRWTTPRIPLLRWRGATSRTLLLTPNAVRLETQDPRQKTVTEIRRVDAGKLEFDIRDPTTVPSIALAIGWSIDGTKCLKMKNWSVSVPGRQLGFFRPVSVSLVLASWWPANSLSASALEQLALADLKLWHPDEAPARKHPNLDSF